MRFSEARGYKVVSSATAETVGRVIDYVVDPAAGSVVALTLKKTSGSGDSLPWNDIAAFGDDAVMVASEDVIVPASGELAVMADKRHHVDGKRVLNTDGVDLGTVIDVEFDQTTGKILALDVKDDSHQNPTLVGIGSYAVVVRS